MPYWIGFEAALDSCCKGNCTFKGHCWLLNWVSNHLILHLILETNRLFLRKCLEPIDFLVYPLCRQILTFRLHLPLYNFLCFNFLNLCFFVHFPVFISVLRKIWNWSLVTQDRINQWSNLFSCHFWFRSFMEWKRIVNFLEWFICYFRRVHNCLNFMINTIILRFILLNDHRSEIIIFLFEFLVILFSSRNIWICWLWSSSLRSDTSCLVVL